MKINESISRIRNAIKTVKSDAFVTDRYIYSIILKHGLSVMSQYLKLGAYKYAVFTKLPYIELESIDKIENVCNTIIPIYSDCFIKKSKYPIPKPLRISEGPLLRSVTSLDYSKKYFYIHPDDFARLMNISSMKKWNKNGYYYVDDKDYLYLFNEDNNDAVLVEGMFIDYTNYVSCNINEKCMSAHEFSLPFSDELLSIIESMVLQEMMLLYQIPTDIGVDDNKSVVK